MHHIVLKIKEMDKNINHINRMNRFKRNNQGKVIKLKESAK